jgi:hypothetical protein
MNFTTVTQDDVYLIDMWRVLVREWKWFVLPLVLVVALTFAYLHAAKPQWQATAWMQIGQVDNAPAGQDPKVEPLGRVVERLQLTAFQNDVVRSIGLSIDSPDAQLYRRSFKLEPLPYEGPLIKLTARATSPDLARRLVAATVSQMQLVHQPLESRSLQLTQDRFDEIQRELKQATATRDALQAAADKAVANGTSSAALTSALLVSQDQQIHALQQEQGELANRLSPAYTYRTSLMWPIDAPTDAVFPNRRLIGGTGIVAALFIGLVVAIARNAWRRRA